MGLFAIFFINTTICFLFFEIERATIRHEIKVNILSQLTDNQLVIFEKKLGFDKDEFEENGKMYDVVRKTKTASKVILYCYLDHQETLLNHKIDSLVKQDLAHNPLNKNQQKLIDLLQQVYISSNIPIFIFIKQTTFNQTFAYKNNFISSILLVDSPPPQI